MWNETVITELNDNYGTNLTATTVALGCFGIFVDICGYLQVYACWYLMLVVALSVHIMTKNLENMFPSSQAWKYLRDVQKVCKELEDVFGFLFKILHLNNTMVFAYFLLNFFIQGRYSIFVFLIFLDTVLILVTYYAARNAECKVSLTTYIVIGNYYIYYTPNYSRKWSKEAFKKHILKLSKLQSKPGR